MENNMRDVIELLGDSSSESVVCLSSSSESENDQNASRPNAPGSRQPPRVIEARGNNDGGSAICLDISDDSDNNGGDNPANIQQQRPERANVQDAASGDETSATSANHGDHASSVICLSSDSSDDSDILSVHTHYELSSGDELIEDISVIHVSDSSSSSEDDEVDDGDDLEHVGYGETVEIPKGDAGYEKMGPRKTPYMGKLSGNSRVARRKRQRDYADEQSPATKRRARPAIGFDELGMPLAPCRTCSKLFSKQNIKDHEDTCGEEPDEASSAAVAQSGTDAEKHPLFSKQNIKGHEATCGEEPGEASSLAAAQSGSDAENHPLETVDTPHSSRSTASILTSPFGKIVADSSSSWGKKKTSASKEESRLRSGSRLSLSQEDEDRNETIKNALLKVQEEGDKMKAERLRNALRAKNEMLCAAKANTSPSKDHPLLRYVEGDALDSTHLQEVDHPLPEDKVATIYLRKNFGEFGDDSTANIDEGENAVNNSQSEGVQKTDRQRPGYEEDERIKKIKTVLQRLWSLIIIDPSEVYEHLAALLHEDVSVVENVAEELKKIEPPKKKLGPYDTVMSSFQELLCARCFRYDCGLHGLAEPYSSDLAAEVAMKKEESGFWKYKAPLICLPVLNSNDEEIRLSKEEKVVAQKLCYTFDNDLDKVAIAMGIPKLAIQKHVILKTLEFQHVKGGKLDLSFFLIKKRKHKRRAPNPFAREHAKDRSGKMFFPCHHTEPCSKETCTCVQNGYSCTNHCIWGPLSRNFFPGCNCKSKCKASSCPCFAGGRECDPDRCRSCQTCTDPPGNLQNRQQFCRNDNIRMRRHKHLLLAKSTIVDAGWGLFCKTSLRRGDYIHEYVGDVIKDEEAKLKGIQYDKENRNYLFEISSDYCVDGLRKSNKTRFMNHNPKPNVIVKMTSVNGDPHIAFYAKEEIPAETELVFDYGNQYFSIKSEFAKKQPGVKKKDKKRGKRNTEMHVDYS